MKKDIKKTIDKMRKQPNEPKKNFGTFLPEKKKAKAGE